MIDFKLWIIFLYWEVMSSSREVGEEINGVVRREIWVVWVSGWRWRELNRFWRVFLFLFLREK